MNGFGYFFLIFSFALILLLSCGTHDHVFVDNQQEFDNHLLADAVIARDEQLLTDLTNHQNEIIASNAWRALAVTDIKDVMTFAEFVMARNDYRAWYALRFQDVEDRLLQIITEGFINNYILAENACQVFIQHGSMETLRHLLSNIEILIASPVCSRAAGTILTREKVNEQELSAIIDLLSEISDERTLQNLLYGFWRTSLNRPEIGTSLYNNLLQFANNRSNQPSTLIDEYLVTINGVEGVKSVLNNRTEKELSENVQLAVVTATGLSGFRAEEIHSNNNVEILLTHQNPHVVVQTLESLKEVNELDKAWIETLSAILVGYPDNREITLTYLELRAHFGMDILYLKDLLEDVDRQNPYVKNRTLPLFKKILQSQDYYIKLMHEIEQGEIAGRHAMTLLYDFWKENQTSDYNDQIGNLIQQELKRGERSVISGMVQILSDEELVPNDFYEQLETIYKEFVSANKIENASVIGEVMEARFSGKFEPKELTPDPFRKPDWNELAELGETPVWVIETEKGTINIRLFPDLAPFTVSSIVSLTQSGAYDNVAFHRVVRNFVVQGGDFDRRDGFGSPDYRIPTEPSFTTFERGSVGIASSGKDTEGSQFFITHTHTPHLDGLYTIFGDVIAGMDVVDQIQIGDRILSSHIKND